MACGSAPKNKWKHLKIKDNEVFYRRVKVNNAHTANLKQDLNPNTAESRVIPTTSNIKNIKPSSVVLNIKNYKTFPQKEVQNKPFPQLNYYRSAKKAVDPKNINEKGKNHKERGKNQAIAKEVFGLALYFATAAAHILGLLGKQIATDILTSIFKPASSYSSVRSYFYYQDNPCYYRQPQSLVTQRVDYDELLNFSYLNNLNNMLKELEGLDNNKIENLEKLQALQEHLTLNQQATTNRTGPPMFF